MNKLIQKLKEIKLKNKNKVNLVWKKHTLLTYMKQNSFFSVWGFYLNKKYVCPIKLHYLNDLKDYEQFCRYFQREDDEIFYFFKKTCEEVFWYRNFFLNSDIAVLDLNFNLINFFRDVDSSSELTFAFEACFVLILPKNFLSIYDIKIKDKWNFYKIGF